MNGDDSKNNRIVEDLNILKALDEAIKTGPWDKSLFFMTIGKKLQDIRERFADELYDPASEASTKVAFKDTASDAGFIAVYVSLYLAEGGNLLKWQTLLNNISGYSVSRPIYKTESDIKAAIKAKADKTHDGYAEVWIKPNFILPLASGQPPLADRFGHPLLTLKEGAIQASNITEFVHISGVYHFTNGALERQGDSDLR